MTSLKPEVMQDYFPPEVCPICAYSLEGSPGEGICPECGKLYDSRELILHGWARGTHANASNSRGKSLLASLIPGLWIINTLLFGGHFGAKIVSIYLLVWGAVIAWALFRRQQMDHPGGVQVRMSQKGMVQIDNIGTMRNKPENAAVPRHRWGEIRIAKLEIPSAGALYLKLESRSKSRIVWNRRQQTPIDAELICPKGNAREVAGWIQHWHWEDLKYLSELRAEVTRGVLPFSSDFSE
jgi:hypothetical protein